MVLRGMCSKGRGRRGILLEDVPCLLVLLRLCCNDSNQLNTYLMFLFQFFLFGVNVLKSTI